MKFGLLIVMLGAAMIRGAEPIPSLADAVQNNDQQAIRALLQKKVDVRAAQLFRDAAAAVLPELGRVLDRKGVELRACAAAREALAASGIPALPASDDDWVTEYLAPILAIRIVDDLDAAIDHINRYGSHHTDAIITSDHGHAMRFLREVDSASVMINASTRFADGFEFGLGAEIGISTDKLHARGPVGLDGLTSQKFVVFGTGQIRGASSH